MLKEFSEGANVLTDLVYLQIESPTNHNNGMTCGKMLLDCMAISITPCLMRYYIASGFVFLVYLHDG